MTAEVCILNKTAVAMAADSAVTISLGEKTQKIYESADKLFELSTSQPIGIMIYNSMSFMEMPLPTIIKSFRRQCGKFDSISEAGEAFLRYLKTESENSPDRVNSSSIQSSVREVISQISKKMTSGDMIFDLASRTKPENREFADLFNEELLIIIEKSLKHYEGMPSASFIGGGAPRVTQKIKDIFIALIKALFSGYVLTNEAEEKLVSLCSKVLKGYPLSPSFTGIVVTGFGGDDKFPTLVSYRIDGVVAGRLKYITDNNVDIDRLGPVAQIVPFAQKEMVDRFVYGVDDDFVSTIKNHCQEGLSELSSQLENVVPDAEKPVFNAAASAGSGAFLKKMTDEAIGQMRERSRREIEDMVSMMPKPELANMAEALVELTSIKRRVSRGHETVGGPVDVAIISREDGFVWVKRKHYFPADKNHRFTMRTTLTSKNGED